MCLEHRPLWLMTGAETFSFFPDIIPDNRCRGFCNEAGVKLQDEEKGGRDMFGVRWVYVPMAGGSMEAPGEAHLFENANEWREKLCWPDIDSWDFAGCAERNREMLDNGRFNYIPFMNGCYFERMVSFMGFESAAMALIDEEQKEAVKELFEKTTELFCRIVDKCCEYFDVDGFLVHDDWGSQRGPFFSPEVAEEMIVPYMKKLTAHIHKKGKVAELHSCGKNEMQIENYIKAGWDIWGPMGNINDTLALFRKYGDRIVIGVVPENDPENISDEEQREYARKTAALLCGEKGKVCFLNKSFTPRIKGAYAEELYRQSRIYYESWEEI